MPHLFAVPRLELAILPTPLHQLPRISERLGVDLWVKRDDMTGLALGGNKLRKLEYLLAEARAENADVVLTTGGPQSNHAVLTAAACRRVGMDCELVLKQRGITFGGNLVLDALLDTPITWVDSDTYTDVYLAMEKRAEKLRRQGRHPYLIPVGGSVATGALGYVASVAEIAEQSSAAGLSFEHIVCATGSGGTQAGLTVGTHLFSPATVVTGYDVGVGGNPAAVVADLINNTARLLATDLKVTPNQVRVIDALGPGYGCPSPAGVAAMELMARTEGLILDPVYTGKALGGLIASIREGHVASDSRVLFVHTGGAGGLFAIGASEAEEA